MKSRNFLIGILIILIASCNQEEPGFVISGKLSNAEGRMVYLNEMTSRELVPVDSVLIDTSGDFELRGYSEDTRFYALYIVPGNYAYLLAKNGDRIALNGDAFDIQASYTISGSKESELIRDLMLEQNRTLERIRRLSKVFNDSIDSPQFLDIKAGLDSAYADIVEAQRSYTFNFIENNLHSQASLMALYQQIGPRHYLLDPEKDFRYYRMVDSSLSILYPESDAVKDLHRQVEEILEKRKMESISAQRFATGSVAPEIALPSPAGDTILLSSLRGKIVLLDFWASWCAPCRHENPTLVRNYKKYSDQGFEIYQVSLDKTRAAWLKGIEDDELDWIHVSDLRFWNSIVVPLYNIQGIPMNYLLDREGRILAQNLRGEQLGEKLEEIFNQ